MPKQLKHYDLSSDVVYKIEKIAKAKGIPEEIVIESIVRCADAETLLQVLDEEFSDWTETRQKFENLGRIVASMVDSNLVEALQVLQERKDR